MSVIFWTTHSLEKLFPQTEKPPKAKQSIALQIPCNATDDIQLAIRSTSAMENVSASIGDLKNGNNTIANANVETFWEWYTYVLRNPPHSQDPGSWLRNAPGFFPDAFLEDKEIRIAPDYTQPLWIKIHIPAQTPAGVYSAILSIHYGTEGKDAEAIRIPIDVTVCAFSLPQSMRLLHTEWFEPEILADYYKIERWSEEHWAWLERVAADMKSHHQNMILTRFLDLTRITELPDASLYFDFSRLDRWIQIFREAGVDWIEGGHVATRRDEGWENEFIWQRFKVVDENGAAIEKYTRDEMDEATFEPYVLDFLTATYRHIESKWGLDKFVQHIADEPLTANKDSWLVLAKKVKEAMPGVRLIDATMCEELAGELEMRVPQIQEIDAQKRKTSDEKLWCYVCLAPQGHAPNRFLDIASIRNRIIFWICFSQRLQGFLHWGYAYWRSWIPTMPSCVDISPWMDATGGSIYCTDRQPLPAGDTHIVYPGKQSLCSSLRWEIIRKGIEDYQMLCMLEDLAVADGGKTEAGKRALSVIDHIRNELAFDAQVYTRNEDEFFTVYEEVLSLLEKLILLRS